MNGRIHNLFLGRVGPSHFLDDAATARHQDAIRDRHDFRQVRRYNDDCLLLACEIANGRVDLRDCADVNSARRLIEYDHRRILGKRLTDYDFLLIAA